MSVLWFCGDCEKEFNAELGPTVVCPGCGRTLEAGPPHGLWDRDAHRTKFDPHVQEDGPSFIGDLNQDIEAGKINMDLRGTV